jgi:type IV secretory pathway TrbL component
MLAGAVKVKTANWLGMRGAARRIVVFVALFAFTLQSFIAQTHIHAESLAPGGVVNTAATSPSNKAPTDHSQADCPFCQAVVHVGSVVASAPPLLRLPFSWTATAAFVSAAVAISGSSAHDWRSRAPPRF